MMSNLKILALAAALIGPMAACAEGQVITDTPRLDEQTVLGQASPPRPTTPQATPCAPVAVAQAQSCRPGRAISVTRPPAPPPAAPVGAAPPEN